MGASPADRAGEGIGLDQGDPVEMTPQDIELAAAAPDDERERPLDPVGKRAELGDMPIDPLAATAAGGEFEG